MIPKESRNELALDTFIKAHPHLLEEMKELSAEDRQQQILWAFEDEAQSRGLEAWGKRRTAGWPCIAFGSSGLRRQCR